MVIAKVLGIKHYETLAGKRTDGAFWVRYCVVRDGKMDHQGERLIQAKDELDVFRVLPDQLIKRHNVDSIEWICGVGS